MNNSTRIVNDEICKYYNFITNKTNLKVTKAMDDSNGEYEIPIHVKSLMKLFQLAAINKETACVNHIDYVLVTQVKENKKQSKTNESKPIEIIEIDTQYQNLLNSLKKFFIICSVYQNLPEDQIESKAIEVLTHSLQKVTKLAGYQWLEIANYISVNVTTYTPQEFKKGKKSTTLKKKIEIDPAFERTLAYVKMFAITINDKTTNINKSSLKIICRLIGFEWFEIVDYLIINIYTPEELILKREKEIPVIVNSPPINENENEACKKIHITLPKGKVVTSLSNEAEIEHQPGDLNNFPSLEEILSTPKPEYYQIDASTGNSAGVKEANLIPELKLEDLGVQIKSKQQRNQVSEECKESKTEEDIKVLSFKGNDLNPSNSSSTGEHQIVSSNTVKENEEPRISSDVIFFSKDLPKEVKDIYSNLNTFNDKHDPYSKLTRFPDSMVNIFDVNGIKRLIHLGAIRNLDYDKQKKYIEIKDHESLNFVVETHKIEEIKQKSQDELIEWIRYTDCNGVQFIVNKNVLKRKEDQMQMEVVDYYGNIRMINLQRKTEEDKCIDTSEPLMNTISLKEILETKRKQDALIVTPAILNQEPMSKRREDTHLQLSSFRRNEREQEKVIFNNEDKFDSYSQIEDQIVRSMSWDGSMRYYKVFSNLFCITFVIYAVNKSLTS